MRLVQRGGKGMSFWIYFAIGLIVGLVIVEILVKIKKRKLEDKLFEDLNEYQESERLKRVNGIKN